MVSSLQGRGSEVLLLSGDGDEATGDIDETVSNRKTVSELLSLDPHESNVTSLPQTSSMYSCYVGVMRFRPSLCTREYVLLVTQR